MAPRSMMSISKVAWCLVVLWTASSFVHRSEAKKGGGGVGAGRGGGGAPTRVGGGAPPPASAGGTRVGGGAPPVVASKPSSSGSRFGTGLAVGAVGGLAAGVIGSQIAHSVAAGSPGGFHDGRYYYYGDRNYPGPNPGYEKCVLQMTNDFNATYKDGSSIRELIYECNRGTDTCCSTGCCPRPAGGGSGVLVSSRPVRSVNLWTVLIPLVVFLIALMVICFFAVKCIKRRRREAMATQQVYYDAAGAQTVVQGNKQWVPPNQHQPQPPHPQQSYYPPQPGFAYPPPGQSSAPPPAYSSQGYQGAQPGAPYPAYPS